MYTVVGNCPRCGAPIYAPTVWSSVTPPPSTPSCSCFPRPQAIVGTTTNVPLMVDAPYYGGGMMDKEEQRIWGEIEDAGDSWLFPAQEGHIRALLEYREKRYREAVEAARGTMKSIEAYVALGNEAEGGDPPKPEDQWDDYDHMIIPEWRKLQAALAALPDEVRREG